MTDAADVSLVELESRGKRSTVLHWGYSRDSPFCAAARVPSSIDRSFGVVVADHISSGKAAMAALERYTDRHLVYVSQNSESRTRARIADQSPLLERALRRRDATLTRRLEERLIRSAAIVTVITPNDYHDAVADGARQVILVPPEVQDSSYVYEPASRSAVAVVGSTDWVIKKRSQTSLINAVAPPLLEVGVEVEVYGQHDRQWAESIGKRHGNVRFLGWVDSLVDSLKGTIAVLLHEPVGGGFQLRTLDALAAGVPVIGTSPSLRALSSPDDYPLAARDLQHLAALVSLARTPQVGYDAYRSLSSKLQWTKAWRAAREELASAIGQLS